MALFERNDATIFLKSPDGGWEINRGERLGRYRARLKQPTLYTKLAVHGDVVDVFQASAERPSIVFANYVVARSFKQYRGFVRCTCAGDGRCDHVPCSPGCACHAWYERIESVCAPLGWAWRPGRCGRAILAATEFVSPSSLKVLFARMGGRWRLDEKLAPGSEMKRGSPKK